jgi:hypothetical protein
MRWFIQKRNRGNLGVLLAILFISSFFWTGLDCEEPLPPYREPDTVYTVRLSSGQPHLERVIRDTSQIKAEKGGIDFTVDVKNIFDETLKDTLRFQVGEIEVWWEEDFTVSKLLPVDIYSEVGTREVGYFGDVTLDPGDSIRFIKIWHDWKDGSGEYVWRNVEPVYGPGGPALPPMNFQVQARIKLFDSTGTVHSDFLNMRVYFR